MAFLEIRPDFSKVARLGELFAAAGKKAPTGLARALNHTGDKARTAMIRVLPSQTGLKHGVFVRALKKRSASAGSLVYRIKSAGGDVNLHYFGARETRAGVSAAPWNHRQIYPGAFMKGGRFPKRVKIAKFNGQVMKRAGSARFPLERQTSGLFIPEEMVKDASRQAFDTIVARDLPDRLVHELLRLLPG